ncbi:MAG TPA: ATP-binding protein [Tissierellaceae bacterium]|nr:ATP-binding protein [Tissierellaceae bacterium]
MKSFVDNILEKLNNILDNKDLIFDIRLIINELIINGVFHGNECVDTKCVNVNLDVNGDQVTIIVEDEGEGFDFNIDSYNPLELKCGGRGLVLVKGLSDELIIDKNKIKAIKYLYKEDN